MPKQIFKFDPTPDALNPWPKTLKPIS